MGTGKPLISILMAVYEPRLDWLKEQLESLEAQTYPNLRLYIRDDCSPTVPFEKIQALVKDCIRSFPYKIERNKENLGSNLTFERLTGEAEGEYFAYCDQDDIWLPKKLGILQEEIEQSGALLVCSDMFIIDGKGKRVADSITKVRHRHTFLDGSHLLPHLLVRNFIVGCTMLVRAGTARDAIPFECGYVHDQWVGIVAASKGRIVSIKKPLIAYRQHGNNQTGILTGISSKNDYLQIRINQPICNLQAAISRLTLSREDQLQVDKLEAVLSARGQYVLSPNLRDLNIFIRCHIFSWQMRLFETILPFLSSNVYNKMIAAAKRGVL